MRARRCPGARRSETGHLFRCRACRVEARLAAAWKRLSSDSVHVETPEPVSESFLRRVTTAIARDHRRRLRRRALLSAAAALLFFFLAGAGHESRASDAVRVEESYAQLLAPSALESLLPD
ncbi:MAG TPA: hypothetical protein VLU06_07510 [Thermoanaerobaculia bacterium]|nr:hypothetical protein [Thermoanaerobaculia bacterium]